MYSYLQVEGGWTWTYSKFRKALKEYFLPTF